MSTGRAQERRHTGAALAFTAVLTGWVAMLAWRNFAESSSPYLVPLLVLGLVIAGTGVGARALRLPALLVVLSQVLVAGVTTSLVLVGSPLPLGQSWAELEGLFAGAVDSANRYASPVPNDVAAIDPLLIAGGVASLLLVDVLACSLRRVPLAGLPLLAAYSVPVSMLENQVSWWVFGFTAAGFLAMLYLHENDLINGWGRPLGETTGSDARDAARTGALRGTAGRIGGVATILALAVPLAVPTLSLAVFDVGPGSGGDSDIEIENPMADLRRDLNRKEDIPLVTVTTDDPRPEYLRISVLNWFTDNEWRSGDRDIPTENLPRGPMPALQGVSPNVSQTSYEYAVEVEDEFRSRWLPTQAPISSIDAPGDWRYDASTTDFIASDDDLTTAGLQYSMTAVELDLKARELAESSFSRNGISDQLLEVPADLPDLVRTLALGITEDAPTQFEKAVALQNWFTEDGGFEYSLERAAVGNGTDELEAFLREDGRVGYCEQFAASMAVMARTLGIPARLGVGFLRPDEIGPSVYQYSAFDMHVWPELYFPGSGWVIFEPTPSTRPGATAPAYTRQNVPSANPTLPSDPNQRDPAQGRPDRQETPTPLDEPVEEESADEAGSSVSWTRLVGWTGGVLLVIVAVGAPGTLRRRRRDDRLAAGPEEAWDELRDTVLDLGHAWPWSRTPRETAGRLDALFAAAEGTRWDRGTDLDPPEDPRLALGRLVGELELARYSRGHATEPGSLRADVLVCVTALESGARPRARRRATWLPISLFSSRSRPAGRTSRGPEPEAIGGVVERI